MIKDLYSIYDEAYNYYIKKHRFDSDKAHDFAIACIGAEGGRARNQLTLGAEVNEQMRKGMMQSMKPHLEMKPPAMGPRVSVNTQNVSDEIMKKFKMDPLEDWRQNGYSESKSQT